MIGTWIGILPGVGGTTASIAAYSVEKAVSKDPDRFGTGASLLREQPGKGREAFVDVIHRESSALVRPVSWDRMAWR